MHHNEYFIIRPGIKKVFIGGQSTNEWRPAIETVFYVAVVQHRQEMSAHLLNIFFICLMFCNKTAVVSTNRVL